MAVNPTRWRRLAIHALLFSLIISLLSPLLAGGVRADENLVVPGLARVSYSNGADVMLRVAPGPEAEVLAYVPEGTVLDAVEGPIDLVDGSTWYGVYWAANDQRGYIVSDYLMLEAQSPDTEVATQAPISEEIVEQVGPTEEAAAEIREEEEKDASTSDEAPSGPPVDVTGLALILNTDGEGVRCRVAADASSALVTVLPEGTQVSLTGNAAGEWQPVQCGGFAGYVHIAFVSYDGSMPPGASYFSNEPTQPEVTATATEVVSTVEATEPAAVSTDVATVEAETPAATEAAASAEATVTTEASPTVAGGMSMPADESAPATESRVGVTGLGTVTGTNGVGVRCRARATLKSSVIAVLPEGSTVELRGIARGKWQPVFCGGRPGFVLADYVVAQVGTLSAAAEAPLAVGGQVFTTAAEQILVVNGTGGGGLRCRADASTAAAVITILAEGAKVNARGPESNGWYPIICGNKNGFANAAFLKAPAASAPTSGNTVVTAEEGSATVRGSGGGLRCRTNPNTDAQVITVLADGETVALRGARSGDWQPVVCANRNGWVAAQYLAYTATPATTPASAFKKGDTLLVTGTNGDGVRMRSAANSTSTVLIVVPEGKSVTVRNGSTGDWVAVTYSGKNGFVHKDFLKTATTVAPTATATATATAAPASSWAVGVKLLVTGTSGEGVRLRSAASSSASVVTVISEGTEVTVRAGSTASWIAVTAGRRSGFIHKDFLKPSTTTAAPSVSPTAQPTQSPNGGLVSGDRAKVTSTLNMRYSASFSAGVAAVAPAGTVVLVTGAASGDFYPVDWAGLRGFMHKDYLTKTTDALSPRSTDGGSTTPVVKSTGEKMVDFAMQYLGYPYVWATSGPSSFDCSGFTYWVVKNIVGRDIGRSTSSQVAAGTSVDRESLQVGDLVFFQNTYTFGLSHVGLYIGGGQFIHAENSGTGVVISSIDSPYYATRWYGAVRIA